MTSQTARLASYELPWELAVIFTRTYQILTFTILPHLLLFAKPHGFEASIPSVVRISNSWRTGFEVSGVTRWPFDPLVSYKLSPLILQIGYFLQHLLTARTRSLTFWCRIFLVLILTRPVYKMLIIQEPNTLELWNKLHFEEKRTESIYHV